MRGLNKIFLLGHIGQKPEIRRTKNENQYAEIRLATNRSYRTEEGWSELTDWHTVKVWGRLAELCSEHLEVGATVAVEGHLRSERWTDPTGEKRSRYIIFGEQVHFVRSQSKKEQAS